MSIKIVDKILKHIDDNTGTEHCEMDSFGLGYDKALAEIKDLIDAFHSKEDVDMMMYYQEMNLIETNIFEEAVKNLTPEQVNEYRR